MREVKEGYCICCGVPRNLESGQMIHDFECIWYESFDMKYKDGGKEVIIFVPSKNVLDNE